MDGCDLSTLLRTDPTDASLIREPDTGKVRDTLPVPAFNLVEVAVFVRKDIAKIKRQLIEWPRNAVLWVELSRLYSIVGQQQKSSRAMQVALGLAQGNRFVVRSAARLAVHHRQPERALRVIHAVHGFQNDPWLLASEIAITCILGRTSRNTKRAVDILKRERYSPEHITELAGAVGTLELTKGTAKIARAFFKQSLVRPNDNALAQAEWAAPRIGDIDTTVPADVLNPHEALARHSLGEADWLLAMNHTFRWAEDEPFSSAPSAIGSYVAAALLEDFQTSLDFCDLGLQSNPEDLDVKNNKVVALAQLGRLDEAISLYQSIGRVESDSDNAAVITATGGLLAFRSGDISAGRRLYQAASELASKRKNGRIKAMAAIYLAREELQAGTEEVQHSLVRAEHDFKGQEKDKEVQRIMENLRAAAENAPK